MPLSPVHVSQSFFVGNVLSGFSPTDNTDHYLIFGGNATNTSVSAIGPSIPGVRRTGTITDVHLSLFVAGTNGTAETGSAFLWANGANVATIANNTVEWDNGATVQNYSITGQTIVIPADSYFTVKIDPPTWVTNPTNVFYWAHIIMVFP